AAERGGAVIAAVLPRRTMLVRKAAGRGFAAQGLAANVDVVFIVSSLNQEWSARRLGRYLTVGWEGGARPVVVLSKGGLATAGEAAACQAAADAVAAASGAAVVAVSVLAGTGLAALAAFCGPGSTAVFVGSSGVGKSTLVNRILGRTVQATAAVR